MFPPSNFQKVSPFDFLVVLGLLIYLRREDRDPALEGERQVIYYAAVVSGDQCGARRQHRRNHHDGGSEKYVIFLSSPSSLRMYI